MPGSNLTRVSCPGAVAIGSASSGGAFDLNGEVERRALAAPGFHPDAASHQRGKPLADRQPQAGAAVLPSGRTVHLAEGLEQPVELVGAGCRCPVSRTAKCRPRDGDACSVASFRCGPLGAPGSTVTVTLPAGVNLMALPTRLMQDLPQAGHVAHERGGQPVADRAIEAQILLERAGREQVEHFADARSQVERVPFEFHLTGLDLREIEDVVDDRQKGIARNVDRFHVVALLRARGWSPRAGPSCR